MKTQDDWIKYYKSVGKTNKTNMESLTKEVIITSLNKEFTKYKEVSVETNIITDEVEFDFTNGIKVYDTKSKTGITCEKERILKKKDLQELYSTVYTLAKGNNVKVNYNYNYKARIEGLYEYYLEECREIQELEKELLKRVKYIKVRGVTPNFGRDMYVYTCMTLAQSIHTKRNISSSNRFMVLEVYHRLKELEGILLADKTQTTIQL